MTERTISRLAYLTRSAAVASAALAVTGIAVLIGTGGFGA